MPTYKNIEITIDDINEYKEKYEIITMKTIVDKSLISNDRNDFMIIKNLYHLNDDDINYLNRISYDKKLKNYYNNENNDNENNNCLNCLCYYYIFIIILMFIGWNINFLLNKK